MIHVNELRHEKEKTYLAVMQILGGLLWLILLIFSVGTIIIWAGIAILVLKLIELYFKSLIYGESIRVTENQYPEIHNIVVEHSKKLNLLDTPDVFICNGSGLVNAFAIRFLSAKYVILMSDLVDLMLKRNKVEQLSMIIGHELGHHAAGHTDPLKNILLKPATLIPFIGAAYGRSCELTADRIGLAVTKDVLSAQNALLALALGSESLADDINVEEFLLQENEIPEFMGVIYKIFSSHPRMTRRVTELSNFQKLYHF